MLAPKLMEFLTIVMEEVVFSDWVRGMRPSNTYLPKAWRWLNTEHASDNPLAKVIEKENASASFCIPYSSRNYEASVVL